MLKRTDDQRTRKNVNAARCKKRKAKGQKVLRVTVDYWRVSEWLYGEGLLPNLPDNAEEYPRTTIEEALTHYIAGKN